MIRSKSEEVRVKGCGIFRSAAVAFSLLFFASSYADEIDVARQALRDGLWEVARTHARKAEGDIAKAVVLESFAREGRWSDVLSTVDAYGKSDVPEFLYYKAAALYQTGSHDAARRLLESADFSRGAFAADATLLHAAVLRQEGYVDAALAKLVTSGEDAESKMVAAAIRKSKGEDLEAARLWREVVAMTNAPEMAISVAAANLADVVILRKLFSSSVDPEVIRFCGLRLGVLLVRGKDTFADGAKLIRRIVKDSPDFRGAKFAFLALADAELSRGDFASAGDSYHEAMEIWPETAKEAWDDCMGIDSAAFTAGVLASAQDSPFDRMFFYATDKGQFGLFDFRECRRGAPWSAFKAFADVARLEERVATTADASRGFYALAAKGADVWVWGVTDATAASVKAVTGEGLEVVKLVRSTFLPKDTALVRGLANSDFYFCELQRGDAAKFSLGGEWTKDAVVALEACRTDWREWNKRAEEMKISQILRSERECPAPLAVIATKAVGASKVTVLTLTDFANSEKGYKALGRMLRNAGVACREVVKDPAEAFFLRDGKIMFPSVTRKTLKNIAPRRHTLDFYVYSNRPLDDLLIEPDMPKLMLWMKARGSVCKVGDKEIKETRRTDREVEYNELPLQQGWNRLSITVDGDRGEFEAELRCNKQDFLATVKASLKPVE